MVTVEIPAQVTNITDLVKEGYCIERSQWDDNRGPFSWIVADPGVPRILKWVAETMRISVASIMVFICIISPELQLQVVDKNSSSGILGHCKK